ncbi:hypothetical protein ARMSODRAFT_1024773 [Armillaria solidipes]|uniref:Family A G protein-coupled receptor-like protein n=1 Tax=Armillaria solidipes TaxID=1076256 RepID=A0A2H3B6B8_9AGAR|nr:hypothetical protein ARMSODRAFT_1024773 [Armillaria solidipes]
MQASPPNFSQDDRSAIFDQLDMNLNTTILRASLHGLYTGIVAVTFWTIFSSPKRLRSTFLHTVIITLYVLSTIAFAMGWAFQRRAVIKYGENYYTVFTVLQDNSPWGRAGCLVSGITGGISTLLVDITIIWRCWALWDRQWRVVFIPIICTAAGMVMKAMQMYGDFHNSTNGLSVQFAADIDWSLIYVVLVLATTVMCTLLIVYRIVRHAPGMSASRKIIEMLIQSSAMYSISLIIYLALVSKNSESGFYADIIAAYVRAIAPTLLVGRVSAHANASSRRQKMVAMWENHPPLVGCFREEVTNNGHSPDDGHQTVSGSSMGKETV